MIKAIVSDFSRVILFPKDSIYEGSLNSLHKEKSLLSNYNPLDYFNLNTELLDFYKSQKEKVNLYIFTTDSIQDAPEFKPFLEPIFTKIFSALKMGFSKKDPEAYKLITRELGCDPCEIIYIDDAVENIEAASAVGIKVVLYADSLQASQDILKTLGDS